MPPVKFYGLSTCIHCKKAKEYLDECKVAYDLTYVDKLTGDERKNCIEEVKKINSGLSFPTIVIGDKVVIGFNKKDLDEALGR